MLDNDVFFAAIYKGHAARDHEMKLATRDQGLLKTWPDDTFQV